MYLYILTLITMEHYIIATQDLDTMAAIKFIWGARTEPLRNDCTHAHVLHSTHVLPTARYCTSPAPWPPRQRAINTTYARSDKNREQYIIMYSYCLSLVDSHNSIYVTSHLSRLVVLDFFFEQLHLGAFGKYFHHNGKRYIDLKSYYGKTIPIPNVKLTPSVIILVLYR